MSVDLDLCYMPATEIAASHSRRLADRHARGREQPRAHRRGQSKAERLLLRLSRRGACHRGRARSRSPGWQVPRTAARRALRHQGSHAHQGQADHPRLLRLRALGAGPRRADRRSVECRGRRDGRQDHDAGIRLFRLHREPALGHHAQSLESRSHRRRLVGRRRRRGVQRLRADRRRLRHGRIGAHSRLLLRRRRLEAELRPHPLHGPAERVRPAVSLRSAGAHHRRCLPVPAGDARAR